MLPERLRNLSEGKRKREWLRNIHHSLMKEYGWIPFEEFKKLPISLVYSLVEEINIQRKEESKQLKRMRRK